MILLLGSTGYVGKAFQKHFHNNSIPFITATVRAPLDYEDLRNVIIQNGVDIIINCAGYVGKPNVDSCEHPESHIEALHGNALLPNQIAKLCSDLGVKFKHISSGCIYTDPSCDRAARPSRLFTETDEPNFCYNSNRYSKYSATKALGEQLLAASNCDYTIYRLRIPFNGEINPRNYISKILKYPILLNATNSITHLDEFVNIVVNAPTTSKCYNVTQPGWITTQQVVDMLKKRDLITNKLWFRDIETFESNQLAPRSNCVLDTSRILHDIKGMHHLKLTPVISAMEQSIDEYAYEINNG